jgi:hypothetical protein
MNALTPDPKAVARRERKVKALIKQMGDKYLLHTPLTRIQPKQEPIPILAKLRKV